MSLRINRYLSNHQTSICYNKLSYVQNRYKFQLVIIARNLYRHQWIFSYNIRTEPKGENHISVHVLEHVMSSFSAPAEILSDKVMMGKMPL